MTFFIFKSISTTNSVSLSNYQRNNLEHVIGKWCDCYSHVFILLLLMKLFYCCGHSMTMALGVVSSGMWLPHVWNAISFFFSSEALLLFDSNFDFYKVSCWRFSTEIFNRKKFNRKTNQGMLRIFWQNSLKNSTEAPEYCNVAKRKVSILFSLTSLHLLLGWFMFLHVIWSESFNLISSWSMIDNSGYNLLRTSTLSSLSSRFKKR